MKRTQLTFILCSVLLTHFGIAVGHVLTLHQLTMHGLSSAQHCWHWGPVKMC